jgi:mono/diheme cytochrome c family protein
MAPRRLILLLSCALLAVASAPVLDQTSARNDEPQLDFFEKKIRPVLVNNCYNCHSANTNVKGGLRVDDRNGLTTGGGRGAAIVPGQPDKSLLMHAVRHTHAKLKMPPEKHLSQEQIADLAKWIKDGAAWPQVRVPAFIGRPNAKYDTLRKEHWAWQPLREAQAPPVKDGSWPRDDIDRFLLAKLEDKGLKPVADADPLTLIRRLTFDLTGLPPTLVEVDNFVKAWHDASAKPQAALEKVVDRLLASPAYGERWGRHWLDVARYGESTGSARNLPYPHAWRYRDYVIDAFNKDKPYDQFIRAQIAGDLLPARSPQERDEQLIATGFLALGVRDVNQRFKVRFVMDNIDEQIDTVTRSVLALTASCARCHDHKFDPIPTTDYYALAGIFRSSDPCSGLRNKMGGGGLDYYDTAMLLPLGSGPRSDPKKAEKVAERKTALADARAELNSLVDDPKKSTAGPDRELKLVAARKRIKSIQSDLISLTDPAGNGPVAMGARDAKTIGDTEIRIRGEAEKLGPPVSRGFLSVLDVPGAPKINPKQSGRLELAQWLTHEKNPLTPRVMANRVWHHLFGQGLVSSVDNFGVTGDAPSNPELLEHLAARFVKDGWSVKKLIRTLVLTHAYQLGSNLPPDGGGGISANVKIDPANRLLWRHSPRRLDAEEIRDAMLAAANKLDLTRPKGSAAMDLKVTELTNVSPLAKKLEAEAKNSLHRSVYLPLLRTLTPKALEVFDFAEQGMVTGSRDNTTVAPQALYLLNDPFVRQQSLTLADRLLKRTDLDDAGRITLAYRLTVSRPATAKEIERVRSYLADYEAEARKEGPNARNAAWGSFCQAILASAEFRYIR